MSDGYFRSVFMPVSLQVHNHDTQSEEYKSQTETEESIAYVSLANACSLGLESLKLEDTNLVAEP